MIELDYLSKLLPLLEKSKITCFKSEGIELWFHVEQKPLESIISTQDHTVEVKVDEKSLPLDIRTDNISDFDKILNWSAPTDAHDEAPLPLVGEDRLAIP